MWVSGGEEGGCWLGRKVDQESLVPLPSEATSGRIQSKRSRHAAEQLLEAPCTAVMPARPLQAESHPKDLFVLPATPQHGD